MKKNTIAAVVVTYNRKELLCECIEGLLAQTKRVDAIYIIDNASTDGTKEALGAYVEAGSIVYVNTGANLGGAGGFEFGMRRAAEAGYDFIWIMDDDTVPTETALEELWKAHESLAKGTETEKVPYGYLSGKTLWKDGTLCNMNLQRDPKMHMIRNYGEETAAWKDSAAGEKSAAGTNTVNLIPSGTATFVSLFLPAAVVWELGLPIGEFFIWADDLEYTRRISRKYPCYVVPASVVLHKCPTNNGGNISTDEISRIGRYRYAYRNEVYVYRREGIRGFLHLLARTPLHVYRVLRYSKDRKGERIRIILGSTLKGINFKPGIRYPEKSI